MDVEHRDRKQRRSRSPRHVTRIDNNLASGSDPEDINVPPAENLPPQLLPFVEALAELLVFAYRRETIERGTGDSPEMHKTKVKDC